MARSAQLPRIDSSLALDSDRLRRVSLSVCLSGLLSQWLQQSVSSALSPPNSSWGTAAATALSLSLSPPLFFSFSPSFSVFALSSPCAPATSPSRGRSTQAHTAAWPRRAWGRAGEGREREREREGYSLVVYSVPSKPKQAPRRVHLCAMCGVVGQPPASPFESAPNLGSHPREPLPRTATAENPRWPGRTGADCTDRRRRRSSSSISQAPRRRSSQRLDESIGESRELRCQCGNTGQHCTHTLLTGDCSTMRRVSRDSQSQLSMLAMVRLLARWLALGLIRARARERDH